MIVKNEAGSIAQTIESVKGCVDRYCILDTGSTDNTVQLIRESFGSTPGQVGGEALVMMVGLPITICGFCLDAKPCVGISRKRMQVYTHVERG